MKPILIATAALSLAGCASMTSLENVTGTWSCPRVDGVCADIATIDAALIGAPATGAAGRVMGSDAGLVAASGAALTRTPDEVARIVFAPAVDAAGHYHSARAIYAVMAPGHWVEAPTGPETHLASNLVEQAGDTLADGAATATAALKLAGAMVEAGRAESLRAPGARVSYTRRVVAEAETGEPAQ